MAISGQILKAINFAKLKGLKDIEIEFGPHRITAIMGCNGAGKTTVLHSIACIYQPPANSNKRDYRFPEFFIPTNHSIWNGSQFEVLQDFRNGQIVATDHRTTFKKAQDRWTPKYSSRVERYVTYIGLTTAVPQIEKESIKTKKLFNAPGIAYADPAHAARVMNLAGQVIGRTYTSISFLTASGKRYLGVQADGIDYSSLSMGAGEQRIFHILDEVLKAPNNGLILVDEIDALCYPDAFRRLLRILNDQAEAKRLQIIFTMQSTEFFDILYINFRHLLQTPARTLCFSETKPDAISRLTGVPQRPLEIFVEDFVAAAIVKKVAGQLMMSKYLAIESFGAAINCFSTVAGASLMRQDNYDNMLFVLDGDVHRTDAEKTTQLRKVLSGDNPETEQRRLDALSKITQFNLPVGVSPERYYHSIICQIDTAGLTAEQVEIVRVMQQIQQVPDNHQYFGDLYDRMDFSPAVGLSKLVDLLCLTAEWDVIVASIKRWLEAKAPQIMEQPPVRPVMAAPVPTNGTTLPSPAP
ncbi:AAA family ATPase [Chitinophaga eiseniae]|uniref:ATP-binding protein n=1 Tax=Chitinophaga eiseniae TaxID=634771 RepID=A0A847SYD8_9BACT|nr:AAA family ATPase [Chitinophaga eiseniae]NLR83052.1 ATP-binding protein [Chitinophaga eiseniae]